jgi:hypothetical protein
MTPLTISERIRLQGVKARFSERSERDQPDFLVTAVGDDGSVQIRPLTFDDLVTWCERQMIGEVE